MKKVKKILASIWVFIIGVFLRVLPVLSLSFYGGDIDYNAVVNTTNEKEKATAIPKVYEIIEPIMALVLPIILFIIGLVVLLNKKLSNRTKKVLIAIAIVILTAIVIGNFINL